ncbi:MAG: PQQ-binding-like beta-propeller repeat protein [Pirellulaceae bacterium]
MTWIVSLLVVSLTLSPGNWPHFQADTADLTTAQVPLKWQPGDDAWHQSIEGYGQSSPVVWGETVYVTTISGPKKEHCHVHALSLAEGKLLWKHDLAAASEGQNANHMSRGAPTPAVDEAGVYCLFEGGNLVALDHAGKPRWDLDLVQEFGPIDARHGLASSLAQQENRLFVWIQRGSDPYLTAISKADGSVLWKTAREEGSTAWSSPVLLPMPSGQTHLVLSSSGSLTGYNPGDGKQLWQLGDLAGNTSPTPFVVGEGKLLVGASGGRGEEGPTKEAMETNGLVQVTQGPDSDQWKAEYLWRSTKATCSFSSPIAVDGRAYYVARGGILFCLDLETGEQVYVQRLGGEIWATPLVIKDRIYYFTKDGDAKVIATGPKFEMLAENALWNEDNRPEAPAPTPLSGGGEGEGNRGAGGRPGRGGPGAMPASTTQYAAIAVPGTVVIRSGSHVYGIRVEE